MSRRQLPSSRSQTLAFAMALVCSVAACNAKASKKQAEAVKDHASLKAKLKNVEDMKADAGKRPPLAKTDFEPIKKPYFSQQYFYLSDSDRLESLNFDQCVGLGKKAAKDIKEHDAHRLKGCNAEHFVVIVPRTFEPPTIEEGTKTFKEGRLLANAFIYDYESGDYEGGVHLDVKSSDSVRQGLDNAADNLDIDLHSQAEMAISDAMHGKKK